MAKTYITCKELIKTLKISDQELIDLETFFDSIPDDEWELVEGKDYRIVNQSTGLREYTESGAYTIARYLETTRTQGFWGFIKEWFLHTKRNIRIGFVKRKILDNSSSLVKRNSQFFLSKSDVVRIFGTRSDYLRKMDEAANRLEIPLIRGQDYDEFIDEGGLHYSLSGVYKLSQAFEQSHSKKNRREECKDVGEVIQPQINDIVAQILKREKNIQTVMDRVKKKRDRETCQVTGEKKNRVNQLRLAVHHLYSQNEYPHLADVEANMVTIACDVHDQFHQHFMGGSVKPCTVDDFLRFLGEYYPHNSQIVIWLEQQKTVLGNQKAIAKKSAHVLYLPARRVT